MPFEDLRQFLDACEEIGELRIVEGADWDLEIGTLAELNFERNGPCLLFDSIKGYPPGYRIACNVQDTQTRALLSVGLPIDLDREAAEKAWSDKIGACRPLPPVEVQDGPILENAFYGDDVDLLKFPTPRWHENDGDARYLGTGCSVVLRDPDTDEIKLGCYRIQVHDRNTVGLYITPNKRGAIIRQKYWDRGASCRVAVSIGHDPLVFLGGGGMLTRGGRQKDYGVLGYYKGSPYRVIREEVTGLPIPATAEIVIAGECPPPSVEAHDEGPFGEWTGYYGSATRPEPIIRVKALYHRTDPIIFGCPPVKNGISHFALTTGPRATIERLKQQGVEEVLDVYQLAKPGVLVVQIRQRYPGHALKAGLALAGGYMGRFVVVVDEDINPRDPADVLWAMGTRCDPATTINVLNGTMGSALDPRIPPDKKARGDYTASQAIILACKPYDWIDEFPKTNIASPELRAQVVAKWKELF